MKKLLHLTLLMLLPLLSKAATSVVEIDFSTFNYSDLQDMPTLTVGDVTLTPAEGERKVPPRYYTRYKGIVFLGANYLTLNTASKAIERIEMTFSPIVPLDQDKAIADKGAIILTSDTEAVWTNNHPVSEIIMTPRAYTLEHGCAICTMKIYLTDRVNLTNQAEAPVIYPLTGGQIFHDTNIVLASPTEDADVYYTIDGSTPKVGAAGTKLYDGEAFQLAESAVIQAISVKEGMTDSDVTGRGFLLPTILSSIAELKDAKEGTWFTVNSSMRVTCVLGSTCFIEDESGAISLFGDAITNLRPKRGDRLSTVTGRFNKNNNNPELEYIVQDHLKFIPDLNNPLHDIELKANQVTNEYINRCVLVRNAKMVQTTTYDYRLTDETGTINIRNGYHVAVNSDLIKEHQVDVELIPMIYEDGMRIYIASVTSSDGTGEPEEPEEPEPDPDGKSPQSAYPVKMAVTFGEENFFSGIWVRGYIVGSYASSVNMFLDPKFGTEDASDLGLILADKKDSTDDEFFLRIIAPIDAIKKELNLKDNPKQMNQYIAIRGMLGSNYKVLMNANNFVYRNPPKDDLDAIGDIAADGDELNEGAATYYNLQGMPVDVNALSPGHIYIKRTNKRATKFIAR